MDKTYYVYFLTNAHHNVIYTGMTSDLPQRIFRHENVYYPNAFTKKYNVNILVYVEEHPQPQSAADREKRLKRWHHDWKVKLITDQNPTWQNLAKD
jgi:putative endonuclease